MADGVQSQSLNLSTEGGSAEAKQWGVSPFVGYQRAEADTGGSSADFEILYKEDNVVLISTIKVCWWTCGGYPGKHVEIQVRDGDDRQITNSCLPANSDVASHMR